jgi:hypothetical protein
MLVGLGGPLDDEAKASTVKKAELASETEAGDSLDGDAFWR